MGVTAERLIVEIIGDSKSVERAFQRTERSAKRFQTTMTRTSRSVRSSMGTLGFTAGTAGVGGGLILGRQFVEAARNAEIVLGQTRVALRDTGLSWQQYSKQIEASSKRISESSAFDDETVLQSFQVFLRGQKDVTKSFELTALAADVARGRYIDLESATQLVNKAAMGQVGALRRAGIQIDKNATSAEALNALFQAYSGSAKTYADSSAGSTDKLRVAWENLAEQAGGPLSEALGNVADELTVIVGLMEKASKLKFPSVPGIGGGLSLGSIGKKVGGLALMPGLAPIIITKDIAEKLFGGGSNGGFSAPGSAGGAGGRGLITPSVIAGILGKPDPRVNAAINQANDTVAGIVSFIDKWSNAGQKWQQAHDRWEANRKAADARRARNELQRQRFAAGLENQLGWLDFGIERASFTKGIGDDRRALHAKERWLKNRIRHAGHTLALTRELFRVQQQIRDLAKSKASDGDPLAGLMQVSSKRMAGLLSAGLGLSPAGLGRLQQNISGQEITVYTMLDSQVVARSTNRANNQTGHRTSRQTSGLRGG